jgi:glycosyltransferase involved in cell wall biosynthesis
MRNVLIIQSEMKRYRLPFFTGLHAALEQDGIKLTVAYSNSNKLHALRRDGVDLPAPIGLKVPGRWLFGRFIYQSLWAEIRAADLVIVGPEIKYLINPPLLIASALGIKKVAFWGLGPNKHPNRSPLAEWIKQLYFTRVDWWFAYTGIVARYLEKRGMPTDRITDVQNSTDTKELARQTEEIPAEEVLAAKLALTGGEGGLIGFYCGMIAEIKDIPLLLDAARLVKQRCPDFHLVIIGSGPGREWLELAVAGKPWIHYLGSRYGRESALYYKMADVFLLAGTVGLAIVDSFAAGLPLVATRMDAHPPEIGYAMDGENCRLAEHNATAFADAIVEVLSDELLRERLRQGAREGGKRYTIEAMVENYRLGIKKFFLRNGISVASGRMPTQAAKPSTPTQP